MKKTFAIISAITLALTLSSCTASSEETNFDIQTINTTPHWDLESIKLGKWNSENLPEPSTQYTTGLPEKVDTAPSETVEQPTEEQIKANTLKETASYSFARLIDSKSKCMIEGRIMYLESYKQSRGDLYNSKSYLYSIVPSSENPVARESTEDINGISYVSGYYTMPKALGNNIYHKTAVRTFSTPVQIVGTSGFTKDEIGNYNSDITLGLPTVIIDMSCPREDELSGALWNEGTKNFKLLFDPIPIPVQTQPEK